jgi:hypothetical protein
MMENTKYVKRLTVEECTHALERLSQLVKYVPTESGSKVALVKQKDWIAVPLAIDGGFLPKTVEGFVKAAEYYKRSEVIGTWISLDLNEVSFPLPVYSVPALLEAAQELAPGTDLMIVDCAVFAGSPDWVYVRMVDDLQIIYGPEPITQMFTGMNADEAFENYRTGFEQAMLQYRQTYPNEVVGEHTLERIYRDLKSFISASPGTEVIIY